MKKVLIISYYWPPAGGVAVLRNLKFVKYLRDFGWEPIVYTPENADYNQLDLDNFKEIPEDIETLRHPIIEPFSLFRKFTGRKNADKSNPVYARESSAGIMDKFSIWVRANFFIPDARFLWIKPSVKYLSKYLKENKVDAILTDGPPHTNTVIGQQLSEKFNIPWLADFQDPWTQVDYYKMFNIGKRADAKHKRLEQSTFKTAKQITIASPSWAEDLEEIGAKKPEVIYYGYDEDDFSNVKSNESDSFIISHAGLLGIDRKPDTFLKVLADICSSNPKFKKDLQLKLAGIVDFTIKQKIEELGLKDNFFDLGTINRKESVQLMLDSSLLLLPVNKADNAKGRLPGKIYEYLRTFNPILALGENESDVGGIISATKSGINCQYDDYDNIKKFVLSVYNKSFEVESSMELIARFSVNNQTRRIAELLDEIVSD